MMTFNFIAVLKNNNEIPFSISTDDYELEIKNVLLDLNSHNFIELNCDDNKVIVNVSEITLIKENVQCNYLIKAKPGENINTIKLLRQVKNLSLKDAKDISEGLKTINLSATEKDILVSSGLMELVEKRKS
jgi:hypothetical protein